MKTTLICKEDTVRLDRFIRRTYPFVTQIHIEKALRKNQIKVNGKKSTANARLTNEDVVDLFMDLQAIEAQTKNPTETRPKTYAPQEKLTNDQRQWLENMIIWEDDDICVLNKPSGVAVQGGSKTTQHLDHMMNLLNPKGHYKLVHRLDRDTSGILVFAKTQNMATYLAEAFRNGEVHKKYWALVIGNVEQQYGTINAKIDKDIDGDREKMVVTPKGKVAITDFRMIQKNPDLTWMELCPKTGRTHQLRVHMMHLGHPIIGDLKYGGKGACLKSKKLHLHARQISLPIGDNNKLLTFTAPITDHMKETFEKCRFKWEHLI